MLFDSFFLFLEILVISFFSKPSLTFHLITDTLKESIKNAPQVLEAPAGLHSHINVSKRTMTMLKSSQDALRQFITNIQDVSTIANLNAKLLEKKLFATATFSCSNGTLLTLELPKMMLDGLDEFNIEVIIGTKFEQLCKVDLMPLPVGLPLKDWERLLIGSLRQGLEEIVSK